MQPDHGSMGRYRTSWSVLIRRVLPDISYIVVKTVVNVRPIDQIQLAVPK